MKKPDGTLETWTNFNDFYPARWNAEIKPGGKVLVFFVGLQIATPGTWKFTYTFEAMYEGRTLILERTFLVYVSA
jgi:hypothetical protein